MGIALVSYLVWAHHMFTSMGSPILNSVFAFTTMLVAVPTGVKIFNWLATIWKGKIVFNTAMLMCLGFIFLFTIGGITGVALAIVPFTWQMHDSYWVVAHFHNILIGGSIFIVMAGIFYWFPKMTGRFLDERMGKWLFWLWFVGFMVTYFPQYILGLLGMPRRIYTYAEGLGWEVWNALSSIGSLMLAFGFLLFLYNVVVSLRKPQRGGAEPRGATATRSSGPPRARPRRTTLASRCRPIFAASARSTTGKSWVYGRPRRDATLRASEIHLPNPSVWPLVASAGLALFLAGIVLQGPLWVAGAAVALFAFIMWANEPAFDSPEIELEVQHHNRTKTSNGMMFAYWFLGSEVALFLMIFSAYFYLLLNGRMVFPEELPSLQLALLNTLFLVSSSLTVHVAHHDLNHNKRRTFLGLLAATLAFGAIFLGITGFEWYEILAHADPRENLYLSAFFTITGLHMLHVVAGLIMLGVAFYSRYTRALYAEVAKRRRGPRRLLAPR